MLAPPSFPPTHSRGPFSHCSAVFRHAAVWLGVAIIAISTAGHDALAASSKSTHAKGGASSHKALKTPLQWGIIAYNQGNNDLALRYFQQAWASQANYAGSSLIDASPLLWLGRTYHRLGQPSQAAEALNLATSLSQPGSSTYKEASLALRYLFSSDTNENSLSNKLRQDSAMEYTLKQQLGQSPNETQAENTIPKSLWQQPIMVFMAPLDEEPLGLSPKQAQRIAITPAGLHSIINQWKPALPHSLPIRITVIPSEANLFIFWKPSLTEANRSKRFTSGITQLNTKDGAIQKATITLSVLNTQGQPRTRIALLQTLTHEFGHALGYTGHSTNERDVMTAQGVGSYAVTQNDIAILTKQYSQPSLAENKPFLKQQKED